MTPIEFDLATIAQDLRVLAALKRSPRESWNYTVMPCIARICALAGLIGDEHEGAQQRALASLVGAVLSLQAPREGESVSAKPHSTDEPWRAICAAAAEVRQAFDGHIVAWALPTIKLEPRDQSAE